MSANKYYLLKTKNKMKKTILALLVLLTLNTHAVEQQMFNDYQVDSITELYHNDKEDIINIVGEVARAGVQVYQENNDDMPSNNNTHLITIGITLIGLVVRFFEKRALKRKLINRLNNEDQANV